MIKVLRKVADILEYIGRGSYPSLKELAAVTGLKKPGLFLILKTLTELGLLTKTEEGTYAIGERLMTIVQPALARDVLFSIAGDCVRNLAQAIHETVVVSVLRSGERFIIAKATVQQTVIVNTEIERRYTVYETATGRILLAGLDDNQLKPFVDTHGLPKANWPGVTSLEALQRELRKIAAEGFALTSTPDGQARMMAVPILNRAGAIVAALGTYAPSSRLSGRHEAAVMRRLKETARRTSEELRLSARTHRPSESRTP